MLAQGTMQGWLPQDEDNPRPLLVRAILSRPGLFVVRLLIIGAFLAFWEAASGTLVSKFWISSPSAIVAVIWRWIGDGSLWLHLRATLISICVGYTLGCTAGIGAGLALGFLPRLYRILSPYLSALYSIPKIALAPLFVILFGIDLESKIALVTITVFFLVLYATIDGVRDIDRDMIRALELMGATKREISLKVIIPGARSWILTGMRISVRYASTAAILGELIASNSGIGFLIEYNAGQFNAAGVFAAVLVLVTFGTMLTALITRFEAANSSKAKGRGGD